MMRYIEKTNLTGKKLENFIKEIPTKHILGLTATVEQNTVIISFIAENYYGEMLIDLKWNCPSGAQEAWTLREVAFSLIMTTLQENGVTIHH